MAVNYLIVITSAMGTGADGKKGSTGTEWTLTKSGQGSYRCIWPLDLLNALGSPGSEMKN